MRNLTFSQSHQFLNQDTFQISYLRFKFIIDLRQQCFIGQFWATILNHTWEKFLIDHNTFQRRRSFQWSIFHITCLITKDGTKQFFFRRRIRFTLRCNLTNHDITRLDTSTDSYDTIFIQVFSSFFTYIRDIRSQLFHTTFCFTNFQRIFLYVNRSQQVFAYHTFVQYDSILIVVTFPRHVSNQQVLTQCQFTLFSRITFSQDVTFLHTLASVANRTQVNRHVLVSLTELRYSIFFQSRFKTYELFVFCTVIQNTDSSSINVVNNTISFRSNLRTRVSYQLTFDTCTYDRRFTPQQRNRLAHHVWSHQCTVSIIMFQERNQWSRDWCNLLRRNVHQINLCRFNNREVSILTRFNFVTHKCTVIIQRSISLCNNLFFLFFSSQINQTVIRKIHFSVFHLTVRSFDESQIINLSKYTQWRNQTDVRTFRSLNRTKTTIVCVVNVTNLKSGTFTGKTTRTKGRHTTLVRDFSQGVCLVHELRQCVRSEEWVDYRRDCLRVNQINRSKHFIVTNVHTFANRTRHTSQTNSKLIRKLLTYCTYTTVTQVVNIIHICFWVNQLNQIFDDFNDIFLREDTHVHISRQIRLFIDSVTTYITKVISFFREEQVVDNLPCTCVISRIGVTQLTVDIQHSFFFRVTRVLLQRIIYDREIGLVRFIFM